MQKLEEVLKAEDAARHAVAASRDEADARVREAEAEGRATIASARARAAEKAVALRDAARESALRRAAEIETEAADALQAQLASARSRTDAAVAATLRKLVG